MARGHRIHVPGAFYHVTLRGNHRQPIFLVPEDRASLEEIVAEATQRHGVSIHAYCWMTNHIHLLAQANQVPVGRMMHAVAMRHARRFQRGVPTTGHLFERRYHARMIDTDSYLLEVVRYIHLNPVLAGLTRAASDYAWSSHRGYLGNSSPPWLTTSFALRMFDEGTERARVSYAAFISDGEKQASARRRTDTAPDDGWLLHRAERSPALTRR